MEKTMALLQVLPFPRAFPVLHVPAFPFLFPFLVPAMQARSSAEKGQAKSGD